MTKTTAKTTASTINPQFLSLFLSLSRDATSLPLTLAFQTPQEAQHFRCALYSARRTLRALADPTSRAYSHSPSHIEALAGAELIEIPRISYDTTGPVSVIIRPKHTAPALTDAFAQLSSFLPAELPSSAGEEPSLDIEPPAIVLRTLDIDGTLYETSNPQSDKLLALQIRAGKMPANTIIQE